MNTDTHWTFAPYRLDPLNEQLWVDETPLPLRPKLFAALRYLVEHPGRLVTHRELGLAVWPRTELSESVLRGCVRDLRDTLGDDASAPRYIETVPHRGYRFVAEVGRGTVGDIPTSLPKHAVVGREADLKRLHGALSSTMQGHRQLVLVSGEPGIGKTTLVDAFVEPLARVDQLLVSHGQCVERYGTGEAYLPMLEALIRLCRQRRGSAIVALLDRCAPTWLMQMPSLLGEREFQALLRKTQGFGRERMLREMAEAIEAITALAPLVLVFEDLHWSDRSSLELIAALARRRDPARLLIVGTYRLGDALANASPLHPMTLDLAAAGLCQQLPMSLLGPQAVGEYLRLRLPDTAASVLMPLARAVHQRTDGNPLFMVGLVDECERLGILGEPDEIAAFVPSGLQDFIQRQLVALSPEERQLLESASVAGVDFSAEVIAAGLDAPVDVIDERCEQLAERGQFIHALDTTPLRSGSGTGHYAFSHALYQGALYHPMPTSRQVRLHRRIGHALEAASVGMGSAPPVDIALHFERAREPARAIRHLHRGAIQAMRRHAYRETTALLGHALELVDGLPADAERDTRELELQLALGPALLAIRGYGSHDVERCYARAIELADRVAEIDQRYTALAGMATFHFVGGRNREALALLERVDRLDDAAANRSMAVQTHMMKGSILVMMGELEPGIAELEDCVARYDAQHDAEFAFSFGQDPCVSSLGFLTWAHAVRGEMERARELEAQMLSHARNLAHAFTLGLALQFAAVFRAVCADLAEARERAAELLDLARRQGFPMWEATALVIDGWACALTGGGASAVQQAREGIERYASVGANVVLSMLSTLLAQALAANGEVREARNVLRAAIDGARRHHELIYLAEMHRLSGEWIGQADEPEAGSVNARRAFEAALEVARRQGAKALEQRALQSLQARAR